MGIRVLFAPVPRIVEVAMKSLANVVFSWLAVHFLAPLAIAQDFQAATFTWSECETASLYECRDPEWRFKFGVPMWLPEIHGTTTVRGRSAPVDVTTREVFDLLDDIDNIYAGRLDVNYGPWGMFVDGQYFDLSVAGGILERIDLSAGFSQAIVDFALTRDVSESLRSVPGLENSEALLLVGGRYNLLEVDRITITGPRGRSVTRSGERNWIDPIIGGQIQVPVTGQIDLSLRGDVGGFDIDSASYFTWNLEALAEFQCTERLELMLGYRLLDIDQRQGSGDLRFVYDVQLKGPMARLAFAF
jgi:hypothetical protein